MQLWLYGKPSWDLEIEGKNNIEPGLLKDHGVFLKEHLEKTAAVLERLQKAGWKVVESYGAIYEITLYKKISMIKAREEFKKLEISLEEVNVIQTEDFFKEGEEGYLRSESIFNE